MRRGPGMWRTRRGSSKITSSIQLHRARREESAPPRIIVIKEWECSLESRFARGWSSGSLTFNCKLVSSDNESGSRSHWLPPPPIPRPASPLSRPSPDWRFPREWESREFRESQAIHADWRERLEREELALTNTASRARNNLWIRYPRVNEVPSRPHSGFPCSSGCSDFSLRRREVRLKKS